MTFFCSRMGATLLATLVAAGSAQALTLSYQGSQDGTFYDVSFEQAGAGSPVNVSIDQDPTGVDADLYAFAFDFSDEVDSGLRQPKISEISTSPVSGATGVCYDATYCLSNSTNLNGGGKPEPYDSFVTLNDPGSAEGKVTSASFVIDSPLLFSEGIFSRFGLRAQSSGPNGQGSLKIKDFEETQPSPVPTPASGFLLVAGLAGFGLFRGKRRLARA